MAIGASPRLLGEILVAEGLTTADAVDRALARQRTTGELLGEALVALGAVNEDDVARALAVQQDLPYVWREELPSTVPVLKNVSAKYLRQYRICPLTIEGGVLTVASADPLNPVVGDDLRQATGLSVKFVVSSATGILETIDRNYDGANATALQRIVEGMDEERSGDGDEDVNHLRDMAFEAPVVRLVNLLVEHAITAEASDIHIATVEDPVEYQLKGVNQIAVKPKIGLSFATGLRHIVRQDPDVILVGEIRDLETAEIAIQASLTGHLVFSTLHTNDAPAAITRLQDMGVEPYLVASVLEAVLAQRLVRRICAACRVPDEVSAADLDALGVVAPDNTRLFRGKGCDDCRGTGYRGRMGIYELFPITEDARSLMLRRASSRDIRQHAVAAGMVTLRLDGWRRACEVLRTVEEILRVTQEDA